MYGKYLFDEILKFEILKSSFWNTERETRRSYPNKVLWGPSFSSPFSVVLKCSNRNLHPTNNLIQFLPLYLGVDQPNLDFLSKIVIASLCPNLWLQMLLCYYLSWLMYHDAFSVFWNLTTAMKKICEYILKYTSTGRKHFEEGGTNLNTFLDLFLESREKRMDHWMSQFIMYIARILQYICTLTLRSHWANRSLNNLQVLVYATFLYQLIYNKMLNVPTLNWKCFN